MPEPKKVATPPLAEEHPISHEKAADFESPMKIETLGTTKISTGPGYKTMSTLHVPEDVAASDVAIPLGTTTKEYTP